MRKLKVLDLFAGGGGFSTGFLQAKENDLTFEIHRALEINNSACDTLRNHIGNARVIQGDITDEAIKFEVINSCKDVDVIIGGPPCQTFSLAGPARSGSKEMREKLKDDPRNTLYKHFFELVSLIKPSYVVFENVEGMLSKKTDESNRVNAKQSQVIELVCDELESIGYTTRIEESLTERFQVVNAADLGVPQQRRRIIIIANRLGVDNPRLVSNTSKHRDVKKAIGKLPVRLPKITTNRLENLINIDKILSNYTYCLEVFSGYFRVLAENYFDRNEDLVILSKTIETDVQSIKHHNSDNVNHLKDFLERYNRLVQELGINDKDSSDMLISHQSRDHNFRDIIIFILMKEGSNSSKFMNPLSDDYNEFLDELYPYARNKHKDTYVKHSWNKPSNTILAHMEKDGLKFIHPDQPRTFTPYEAQLLQSFPKDYKFFGGRNDQYRQIGNAVPPLLGKVIGEAILKLEITRKTKIDNMVVNR
ncbi:DNA cytosine methyltransferase [Cytobacillus oceanisediminis]|uniref:DNA cytosine methyltransferase n=1 Tax=Cytobacillus oceanisediminis TaxID=665099 RepID=UPI001D1500AB|nr:DNA cytosine methyltransferase [Cytobacillus oceanisediminis]MCC3646861.1 DNA cytosine methyltransferase [Cytobacillus oceanisediminis]